MPTLRSYSPITKTPVEILTEIFLLASGDSRSLPQKKKNTLLTITWVSRLWRDVALGSPCLWSTIYLGFNSYLGVKAEEVVRRKKEMEVAFAYECISRSGVVPISLWIDPIKFDNVRTAEFVEALRDMTDNVKQKAIQVQELHLSIGPPPFPPYDFFNRRRGAPMVLDPITTEVTRQTVAPRKSEKGYQFPHEVLRTMALSISHAIGKSLPGNRPPPSLLDSLCHLSLQESNFEWHHLFFTLPPSITHLVISRPIQRVSLSHFLELLIHCQDKGSKGMKPSFLELLELNDAFLLEPDSPNSPVQISSGFWSTTHSCKSHLSTNQIHLPNLTTLKLLDICAFTLFVLLDKMIVGSNTDVIIYPLNLPDFFHESGGTSTVPRVFRTLYEHAMKRCRSNTGDQSGRMVDRLEINSGSWGMSVIFHTSIPTWTSATTTSNTDTHRQSPTSSSVSVSRIHIQLGDHGPTSFLEEILDSLFRHPRLRRSLTTNLTSLSLNLESPLKLSPFVLFATLFGHPERVPNLQEINVSGWGGLSFIGCLDWCCQGGFGFRIGLKGLDSTGLRGGPRVEANQVRGGGAGGENSIVNSQRELQPLNPEEEEEIVGATCFPSLKRVLIKAIPIDGPQMKVSQETSTSPALFDELVQNLCVIFKLEKAFGELATLKRKRGRKRKVDTQEVGLGEGLMKAEWEESLHQRDGVDIVVSEKAMADYVWVVRQRGMEWWRDIWEIPSSLLARL
ncbi:hypothetical protein BDN72DRAFT_879983 [Pluteus cervinus]|uniref:Uncharacterized protein n=1 Tax=Pluteus cervinus TaxID=181527 RepID=A0ACD3AM02_9AGAR|nr:hypothetical protein BDN72DRAFT_879983 [Pluteus cervinus]